ncbi:MAG TPA: SPOR domain-containing protein [Terriglobales bacterium]|nr:SPOR domain-containing protein [Terriglobales bacterium]
MANQDTELTLSTGKLLGIFFGMVAICAVFFSLGYAVGKGSSSAQAQVITDSSELSSISSTGGAKPGAGKTAPPVESTEAAPSSGDTTPASAPRAEADKISAAADAVPKLPAPELNDTAKTGFMVQVAAVSKKEDAEALVAALRKKQYPVLVVNNVPNSPLYHVQVGPFSQQKDAEAMRTKLASDGYNAILKK